MWVEETDKIDKEKLLEEKSTQWEQTEVELSAVEVMFAMTAVLAPAEFENR
eukprot:CAMPEP_0172511074 /NCGR_PEP_ID=MMETSP1066-20121228/233674_1 /TAXON_ID=671091 /ORGANISM="Coscinodiscus wailesii, Strain CCMP2513" /LENGTH=50 /DNA_ID=CAMNT_0013290311 /DNA_START=128 /DNA_END=280 /DNA_ORIENTATION=+